MTMADFARVPPGEGVVDGTAREHASLSRRAAARLIDFAVGVAMLVALVFLLSLAAGRPEDGTGVMLVSIACTFVGYQLYEVVLLATWGRTLGKLVMGLEVVRADGGGRPGLRRSFIRNLVPTLALASFFPLYPLPYLLAVVAGDHRWPHDRLAGTQVMAKRRS